MKPHCLIKAGHQTSGKINATNLTTGEQLTMDCDQIHWGWGSLREATKAKAGYETSVGAGPWHIVAANITWPTLRSMRAAKGLK